MVADPEGLLNMNINIHAYDKFAQAYGHMVTWMHGVEFNRDLEPYAPVHGQGQNMSKLV